jgi:hypothetical protein
LRIAKAAGVSQFVLLSAICVQRPLLAFQKAKLAFESELAASGLTYSIVRPTAFFKSLSGQVARVQAGKPFSKALLGAKLGTLVATVGLTAGAEYLVYFAKNLVSVGLFNTKNFEAVAGLEASQAHVADNVDPVLKARSRARQVAKVATAVVAGSLAIPALVKNHAGVERFAHKLLKQIDFTHDAKSVFQLSKPILATLMASGFIAGLDSARSNLERWENGVRVAGVIGFLLAGRELAGNIIAGWLEKSNIRVGETLHRLGDFVKLTDKKLFQQESALSFSMVKSEDTVAKELATLGQKLTPEARKAILGRVRLLGRNRLPLALSAGVSGLFLTALSYTQTKWRYSHQLKQAQKRDQSVQKAVSSFLFPAPPAAQLAINPSHPAALPFTLTGATPPYFLPASVVAPPPLRVVTPPFAIQAPAAVGW